MWPCVHAFRAPIVVPMVLLRRRRCALAWTDDGDSTLRWKGLRIPSPVKHSNFSAGRLTDLSPKFYGS